MAFDIANVIPDFGDVEGEARAVRESAALFDFSFIARGRVTGRNAVAILERFQPRPVGDMAAGAIRYALRLGAGGAVEADLTLWRLDDHAFEVMSGRRRDIAALIALAGDGAQVEDLSDSNAIFAVQGPGSLDALAPLGERERLAAIPYFGHAEAIVAGIPCRVGRLGYTGEKGFEIVADKAAAARLRAALAQRARPAGFAAADILRIEAGFMLFVNECRLGADAAALGLERLAPHTSGGSPLRLVAFTAEPEPVRSPWQPEELYPPERGEIAVTSACTSVALEERTIGLGFVHVADAAPGTRVRDRTRRFDHVRVERIPLYDPAKQRPRGPWPPPAATGTSP
ncbi:MAG: aminomethyl transferase family protein [Rhodospirillales bacterium]|nr:aminomethyl transferase family protein [Rhodospirillales bacterium]